MAAKKEYGWVDYSNLALNVVQTAQLENVRHQLAQLQQIHLDERAKAPAVSEFVTSKQGINTLQG
jgi:hypothetical protein